MVLLFCLWPFGLHAGVETVEIPRIQFSRSLSAIVTMPGGSPLPGAKVEEFSCNWKTALRTVQTDAGGTFSLAPVKGRKLYYIQVSAPGFNPLRFRLKRRMYAKPLKLQMELST
jgi:hypothetical protein